MTSSAHTYQQMAQAIDYLATTYRERPTLAQVARQANLSEFHFQRLFTEWAGISPKKFSQYLTLDYARQQLRMGAPLADVAYDAGLSGTGRLHDLFVRMEGMTPGQYRQAGAGMVLQYGTYDSPFGPYLLGLIGGSVALLHFRMPDDDPDPVIVQRAWPNATLRHDPAAGQPIADQIFPVNRLVDGVRQPLSVLLRGSAFQLAVWEALLRIPEGRLASYDQLATAIGQPGAVRAVGTALGHNPVGYLIPCHRVIRKTGLVGGYRWGVVRKQALLGWEAARH